MVFLETSAAVDFCFWDDKVQAKIRAAFPQDPGTVPALSSYVLFELGRGFLHYLTLFHAKCHDLKSLSEVLAFMGRLYMQTYYRGAVNKSLEVYVRSVTERIGLNDAEEIVLLRAFLRSTIRRGWQKARASTDAKFNPIGCRTIGDPHVDKDGIFVHELPLNQCGIPSNCGLKRYFSTWKSDFERIRDELAKDADPDAETQRRIKSLKELCRLSDFANRHFSRDDCYNSGDAIICHEVPTGGSLVTKNGKHLVPIGAVLGRTVSVSAP